MKNLIPHFISEQFEKQCFEGNFQAVTMFIDISGFTAMTQALMKNGKEGAEILTEVINRVFTPSIDAIYKYNGFISTFAGDAFTAIFPTEKTSVLSAFSSALEINKIFEKIRLQKTKFGNFQLTVKIGLSVGKVDWKIIRSKKQNSYYFRGKAINNCAYSEHNCEQNEIIFDKNFYHEIHKKHDKDIEFSKKTDEFYILNKLNKTVSTNLPEHFETKADSSNSIQEHFIPKSIINLKTRGEFREIISCFISFTETSNFEKRISKIIELTDQFGGYFNKIDFGDKGGVILVLFGAPTGKEKLFKRACDFALAIRNLNFEDFKTRIGLTFGTAFAGFVGSEKRDEYTALGMTVNLSARYIMKAEWNEIFVDRYIFPQTKNNFKIDYISDIKFKGFIEKIPVYKLINKKETIQKSPYQGKLVGREKESQRLGEIIQPIYDGKFGGIVYVDGIAGIGKSRLVNELKEKGERRNGKEEKVKINWFYMPCDEILRKSFNPIINFFNGYFEQSKSNSNKANKLNFEKKLNNLIKKTESSKIKNELFRTKSIIGVLVNLYWKNSLYEQLDAKGKYENTLYSVKNFIKAESLQKPVIIELEDGHWIDPDTKKILKILTTNVQSFPFMIISACRFRDDGTEFDFGLTGVESKRINLEYLSKDGSKQLILEKLENLRVVRTQDDNSNKKDEKYQKVKTHNKLDSTLLSNRNVKSIQTPSIPSNTINLIYKKSEGNPFFIEQIILYFRENRLFDDEFNIKTEKFKIPSNINAIIIARIDRLKMELKEVIKIASVLGREFSINILSKMLMKHPIGEQLLEGEKEVIWEALTELKYIFKHALIREAVYEMQLKKELRKLHKLAAEVIEENFKDEIESYYQELVNHFEKAEISEKIMEYLEKAGDYAKENYENENAINFYNRLLQNSNIKFPISKRVDTILKKGDILKLIGKWKEAEKMFRKALRLSEEIEDKKRIAYSNGSIGWQLQLQGDYEKAREYFEKQLKISEKLGNKKEISKAIGNIGIVFSNQGKYTKAIECYEKQLKIGEELRSKKEISKAVGNMGIVFSNQGNYPKAIKCFEKQYEISEELKNKGGISKAIGNMGIVYWRQCNYPKAIEYYKKQLKISEELGNIRGILIAVGNMGSVYRNQSNYSKATECYEKQLKICEELGDKSGISIAVGNMGYIFTGQSKYSKAMECYEKNLEICEKLGNERGISIAVGNMGIVFWRQGNLTKAMECYKKKFIICEKLEDKRGISNAIGNMGIIYRNQGNYDKAVECYEKQLKIAEELGDKSGISIAVGNMGFVFSNQGIYSKAMECYKKKLKICEALEDKKGISTAIGNMGSIYQIREKYEKALKFYEKAFSIAKEYKQKWLLPHWLSGKSEILYRMGKIEDAKENNEECLRIAKELKNQEHIFKSKVRKAKIEFKIIMNYESETETKLISKKSVSNCIESLEKILQETKEKENIATLNYELWKITKEFRIKNEKLVPKAFGINKKKYRETALVIYRKLYKKTPQIEYKNRIEELEKEEETTN